MTICMWVGSVSVGVVANWIVMSGSCVVCEREECEWVGVVSYVREEWWMSGSCVVCESVWMRGELCREWERGVWMRLLNDMDSLIVWEDPRVELYDECGVDSHSGVKSVVFVILLFAIMMKRGCVVKAFLLCVAGICYLFNQWSFAWSPVYFP